MFCKMKHFSIAIVLLTIIQLGLSAKPSRSSNSADITTVPPTTPHPVSNKLEQLEKMKESALKGWYDMVNTFLVIVRPARRTLDDILEHVGGEPDEPAIRHTLIENARLNYVFLLMLIIGIVYVIVMLIAGILFLCCRFWGRCGAKESQRIRRSDNWWRTMYKFCLILMIAFLVVPITCMWIINRHMTASSDTVKGNSTEALDMLIEFADQTDADVDRKTRTSENSSALRNFDSFKLHFVELLHDNISSSIDHGKLEEIKNIVTWVLSVEDQHTEIANATALSKAIKDLKRRIADIREQTKHLNCTDSSKKICNLDLKQLPLEKINVDEEYVHVQSEFQNLLKINFEELKSIIDKIQNNTALKIKIEQESENIRQLNGNDTQRDSKIQKMLKEEVKAYSDKVRKFATDGKRELKNIYSNSSQYEDYRWYSMFGIAAVLFIPVLLLSIGLICGCCGYEKERHPTKRSTTSHCGGCCLILAVYIFFLICSALMLVCMFMFIAGGGSHTYFCVPLYQEEENFPLLDQYQEKWKLHLNDTIFEDIIPSQVLSECRQNHSIMFAIGLITNGSTSHALEKLLSSPAIENSLKTEDFDNKLQDAVIEITSGIRKKLDQFTNALNLKDMKDMPLKLQEYLRNSKANLSRFIDEIRTALNEETNGNTDTLHFVNDSAAALFEVIDDFEKKLNNFSTPLLNIYREADNYKDKIKEIEKSLDMIEEKLPNIIKTHFFKAIASSPGLPDFVADIGNCYKVYEAFVIARTTTCEFLVDPINGFWFALGWALLFIIPTIFFAVKLSRYYLRMKYDDDLYIHDSEQAVPLEDMSRKPFSYTSPGPINWMHQFSPHQNYMVHPTSNQARQFHYK